MGKVVAFIPVRGGSKSIPLKNIKEFCGKPLVYWNIHALQQTVLVDEIIIATDSIKIEEVVKSFGFSKLKVYQRSEQNAADTSSTESVMLEYLNSNECKLNDADIFMLVQATSPLTQSNDFMSALNSYFSNDYDSMLSCVKLKRFFWETDGSAKNYDYKNRPRRQDFEGEIMENGAFYINKVANIQQSKNRLSGKIGIHLMPEYTAIEIDEEDDWMLAEKLMRRHILSKSKKLPVKLFLSDVDGVLTDSGMYYSEKGDELKKFNTHDGMAFKLLKEAGVKTGIITSEITEIVKNRAKKLNVDYLFQGEMNGGKLNAAREICNKENISLQEVAYIGDDINCFELLSNVGLAACPSDALEKIKGIPAIIQLSLKGGEGVVREFADKYIL
ncbi:MAG: cytidylyltransferase domain-containing protein [Bacteroidales bacterium]